MLDCICVDLSFLGYLGLCWLSRSWKLLRWNELIPKQVGGIVRFRRRGSWWSDPLNPIVARELGQVSSCCDWEHAAVLQLTPLSASFCVGHKASCLPCSSKFFGLLKQTITQIVVLCWEAKFLFCKTKQQVYQLLKQTKTRTEIFAWEPNFYFVGQNNKARVESCEIQSHFSLEFWF